MLLVLYLPRQIPIPLEILKPTASHTRRFGNFVKGILSLVKANRERISLKKELRNWKEIHITSLRETVKSTPNHAQKRHFSSQILTTCSFFSRLSVLKPQLSLQVDQGCGFSEASFNT